MDNEQAKKGDHHDRIENICFTAPYCTFSKFKNKYIIETGVKQQLISTEHLFKEVVKIANFCLVKRTKNELMQYMRQASIANESLVFMLSNRFIIDNEMDLDCRFSRNHIYFENLDMDSVLLQQKIANKHSVIAGCGGIGNTMSYMLCSFGIKKLTLVDDDIIEYSNLNRQFMFTE